MWRACIILLSLASALQAVPVDVDVKDNEVATAISSEGIDSDVGVMPLAAGGGNTSDTGVMLLAADGEPALMNSILPDIQFKMRIVVTSARHLGGGRLEIQNDYVWGTVCDTEFNDKDASVACKYFGYNSGFAIPHFGGGAGPIWLDKVNCKGDERHIGLCSHSGWGKYDSKKCDHFTDVGVRCY